ncbi:hypothetical protein KY284_004936, partial [Solanum tuberosum]
DVFWYEGKYFSRFFGKYFLKNEWFQIEIKRLKFESQIRIKSWGQKLDLISGTCFGGRRLISLRCFNSIISFGDSLTDTGNEFYLTRYRNPSPYFARLPYGETFFHRPTGRFSNGRLIINFIAESLGIPLVPAYLGGKDNVKFTQGVNFAVGGSTALDPAYLSNKGVKTTTNASLVAQLGWFKEMLSSHCKFPSECKEFLQNSLILVGEIGGNDFIYGFFGNNTKEKVESYVPAVINSISSAIQDLQKEP